MATTFWPNYLFFTDFSSDGDVLAKVPLGVLSAADATLLAASLSTHDKGEHRAQWTDKEEEPYTLAGAEVKFNDVNHTHLPSNALFKYALVLELPWANGPHNLLVLQYNETPRQA
jgi:hypothetical protein